MFEPHRRLPSSDGRIIFGLSTLLRCFHGNRLLRVSFGSLNNIRSIESMRAVQQRPHLRLSLNEGFHDFDFVADLWIDLAVQSD